MSVVIDGTNGVTVPAGATGDEVPQAQETYGPKNGQLAGMRNRIINGAFAVNQRSYVSGTATTAGQYTLDRWKVTGTGGITFSTSANKTTVTIPSGQTLQQVIEGLNLQTGTYVLSWEGTAQGRIASGSYGASGSVTASITGGTNTTIEFKAGTVANVQLELGTIATPFEHRPIGAELALCQRYCQNLTGSPAAGVVGGGATASLAVSLPVPMRALPTVSFERYADWSIHTGAANSTFTGHSVPSGGTSQAFELQLAGLSAGSPAQAAQLRNYDVGAGIFRTSAHIRCDSEL